MHRRQFLTGIVAAVAGAVAGESLLSAITDASPPEITQSKLAHVSLGAAVQEMYESDALVPIGQAQSTLYHVNGDTSQLINLPSYSWVAPSWIDVTSYGDGAPVYYRGFKNQAAYWTAKEMHLTLEQANELLDLYDARSYNR